MKLDQDGIRLCDSKDCEFPATHTLVWTEHQCHCFIHVREILGLAEHMGFPTPARTLRQMTPDEMMPDES